MRPEIVVTNDPDRFMYNPRFGSTYYYVNPLPTLKSLDMQVAATLLPCQVKKMDFQIECTIELLCGLIPTRAWTMKLIELLGVDPSEVNELTYRAGWPGHVAVIDTQGNQRALDKLHWPTHNLHRSDYHKYISKFCHQCTLHEVGGDLVVGDPWGIDADLTCGHTMVCVRNSRWNEVIDEMTTINVEEIPAQKWETSLDGHVRNKHRKRMYDLGSSAREA
jgi:coenzyme F420-reducing hydrogenase beta subunit